MSLLLTNSELLQFCVTLFHAFLLNLAAYNLELNLSSSLATVRVKFIAS